jgi:hypothetical protein
MSYIFNGIVLWAVIFKSLDWRALTVSFGTQTAIYLFYFASKKHESEMMTKQSEEDSEPQVDRNPENN